MSSKLVTARSLTLNGDTFGPFRKGDRVTGVVINAWSDTVSALPDEIRITEHNRPPGDSTQAAAGTPVVSVAAHGTQFTSSNQRQYRIPLCWECDKVQYLCVLWVPNDFTAGTGFVGVEVTPKEWQ